MRGRDKTTVLRAFTPHAPRPLALAGAVVLAAAIFTIDTFTSEPLAIAVLYVIVILIAATAGTRRWVLRAVGLSVALTLVSFLFEHGAALSGQSLTRCAVSLATIGLTAFLSLRNLDVTTRLRQQSHLLDQTHDSICVRDMVGLITYWNQGAETLYGWTASEARGRDLHELLSSVLPMPHETLARRLSETGIWSGEIVQRGKDGRTLVVDSRWALMRDDQGRLQSILETCTDITDRKATQADLNRAQAELAHASRVTSLGQLTASIAHEVSQPLAGILNHGQAGQRWLDRDPPDLSAVARSLTKVVEDAQRATEVIERVRRLARKALPRAEPVELNALLDETVLLLGGELRLNGISPSLRLSPDLGWVQADRVQLQQVLINLMMNALQAMAETPEADRALVLTTAQVDGEIRVAIRDSGPGVAPELREKLFSAFFTTKPDGMGMGLSICCAIIQSHNGRIWARCEDGGGVTFEFALPTLAVELSQ